MFYTFNSDVTNINVVLGKDAVWVCQLSLAEISDTTHQNNSLHLNNIYKEAQLNRFATVKET